MTIVRHNYEYEVDTESNSAPANVARMVGQNKRVVEIGCGPGSITKILATQGQCSVTGLELDAEAIKKATPYCEKIIQADLNANDWPQLLGNVARFDVAVAADVLEHLYDPWAALQKMASLIKPEGYLVISIPHVGHAAIQACMVNGDFEYHDWGLLDRTHIRFFGLKNIETLFAQAKLKIIDASYVTKLPEDTEFKKTWLSLSIPVQNALMSISKHSEIYQVVVKAVPINSVGEAIVLAPPEQQYIPKKVPWRTRIGQHLSPQTKAVILKVLRSIGVRI